MQTRYRPRRSVLYMPGSNARALEKAAAETADVFLALGTSLSVYPVAWLPMLARRRGARVVIVNGEPTEQDDIADVTLIGRLGEVLPALARRVRTRLETG